MPIPLHSTAAAAKATKGADWVTEAGLHPEAVLEVDGYIRKQAYAKRYAATQAGLDVDDLIQEGRAGALKAAAKFKATAGTKFLTYVAPWIHGAISDVLQQSLIRPAKGNAKPFVVPFDQPLLGEDGEPASTLGDNLQDETLDVFKDASRAEAMGRIRKTLSTFEARDRRILIQHYGLDGQEPKGLLELAHSFGLSRQQISKILDRGLALLRQSTLGRVA
jgi:RNA polymerase sigma factor (sigma-70 family)